MKIELENVKPRDIESRSFQIITKELGDKQLIPGTELIVKRCIHTSADFDYADNLAFSEDVVNKAIEALKAAGAKRAVLLPVSAPFHSTLMQPAADRLAEVLAPMEIKDIQIPVVANVTAQEVVSGAEIKKLLIKQAASPVLWETSVRNMVANGVDTFVEVGPGKVLTGFTKKIAKGMAALNVEDPASLEKTLAALKA